MGRSKSFIATFLALLLMATPAMEVYATNTASVSVNSPVVSQTESTQESQEDVDLKDTDEKTEDLENEEPEEESKESVEEEEKSDENTSEEEDESVEDESKEAPDSEESSEESGEEVSELEGDTVSENNLELASLDLLSMSQEERLELFESRSAELSDWAEENGRIPNGYRHVDYEVDMPSEKVIGEGFANCIKSNGEIPISYDARSKGYVSSVKTQNPWETCWAFATVSAAESAYMRSGKSEINMSESHLVDFFYNEENLNYSGLSGDHTYPLQYSEIEDPKYQTEAMRGGNNFFTTWGLARWTGVAKEDASLDEDLVYSTAAANTPAGTIEVDDNLAFEDVMHLENAYWLSLEDRDSVKAAVMEYDSIGIDYYYTVECDSDTYKGYINNSYNGPAVYYNPYYSSEYSNHAVSIVGWNDSFSRENFAYTYDNQTLLSEYGVADLPEKDGAWLIKNSWGTEAGDAGYFWISYEDLSLQGGTAFAFDFDSADNYDHNYQYDGSNGMYYFGTGKVTTAAAVYKADMGADIQSIEAVGVGFASADNDYTVKIYGDLENTLKPDSGTLLTMQTGTTLYEGFYTIELDNPVPVKKGEAFSVVIEVENSESALMYADTSYNGGWIEFEAKTNPGETFFKYGSSWNDAAIAYAMTMRIKAFTKDAEVVIENELTEDMIATIPVRTYTEKAIEPTVKVSWEGVDLTLGTDYTVSYSNNTEVGTATATITGIGAYSGTVKKEFTIAPKTITADMITVQKAAFTGVPQNPVVVMNGDVEMTAGESATSETDDYTIVYNKEPLNAGTYQATITGINGYTGTVKATVKIDKTDIATTDVSLDKNSVEYNMTAQKPNVTVKIGDTVIDAKSNYTIKYTANTNVGTATVTITGKGSLSGKTTTTFAITSKSIDSEGITVAVAKATYSGSALSPKVTVKDGTKTLSLNKDYTLSYEDNVDASTEAQVSIIGKGNYSGTKVQPFVIDKKAISASSIKADLLCEDGNITPEITINAYSGKIVFESSDFDYVIKEAGKDVVCENSAVKVGAKYDVVITLKGNYTGTNTVKKVLCKTNLDSATYTLAFKEPDTKYVYSGKAYKPAVVVKHNGETVLAKDYTVSYLDNTNAGEATVIVKGKNAIAGTISKAFIIEPKDVTQTLSVADIKSPTYTSNPLTPAVTVKDGKSGLKVNKDYTLTHSNNVNAVDISDAEPAKAIVKLSNNYKYNGVVGAEVTKKFGILPAKINSVKATAQWFKGNGVAVESSLVVKAGKLVLTEEDYTAAYDKHKAIGTAKVTVTAKAGSNYTGEKKATYKIAKENISKAIVEGVTDLTYTGSALEQASVIVKNQAGEVIPASDYTLTTKNNTKVGKATITIKADSNSIYMGSKSVTFKINPAELDEIMTLQEGILHAKTYDGKKQTYASKELTNAFRESTTGNLIPASAYKITYINNVEAGDAYMVVTGKGNYTGTKMIRFTIKPKNISGIQINIKGVAEYKADAIAVPEIRYIKDGKYSLVKGKDYTYSCSGAKQKGIARITITGTGNYTGAKSFYYTVK